MAEINFNQLLGQMNPIVRQNYEGVMGGKSFPEQYDPNKRTVNADGTVTDTNSESLTMKDGYTQMVDAYNQEQQIPETGILSTIGSALNPFSKLSASEMPIGQRNQFPGISVGPMSNVERDFPGMSTGDIIDSMQDREYVGPSYEKNFDYLGAGSPMLSKGFQVLSQTPTDPEMSYPYTTGRGNARLSSEKNYDYDPAFGDLVNYTSGPTSFTDRNTFMRDGKLQLSNSGTQGYFDDYERVPSLQRALGNERFALAPEELTSQPQELGYVKPAAVPKEAIYQDRIMNRNLSNSNYEPRQGILQGLRSKIGSGFNNVKDGITGSSTMDFLRGLPTPGNLLMNMAATRNPLNPRASNYNPTLQGQVDFMKDQGMYGKNPNTGLGQITGGRLAGKHLVSFAGSNDLGKMYGKDLSKLQGYLATMPQRFSRLRKATLGSNLPGSYQDKINNLNAKIAQNKREAQQAQLAREASTANRARAANASVYANADARGFTRGGGGFASHNTGTNSNFSNNTGRGRTGYQEGGLASMFTRRR